MHTQRLLAPTSALALGVLLLTATTAIPLAAAGPSPAAAHDIYNPARIALVNAQRQVAEALRAEQELLERMQRLHGELDSSLEALARAERLDPAMAEPIATVRAALAELQANAALCPMGYRSSIAAYSDLLAELQTLIDHY